MKFRLKKYVQGWICEYAVSGVFKTYWKPITFWAGTKDPYFYRTPEDARDGALSEIKKDINFSFHFKQ